MKTRWILFLPLISLVFSFYSCKKDEGFHQVSPVERDIYLKINSYRTSQGYGSLVEQFLLFKEGRVIAEKMATGIYMLGDPKAQKDVEETASNLGGTSSALLSLTSNLEIADSIVNYLKSDPSLAGILKDEFTQCGVGLATGSNELHYIAIILINIPD